MLNIVSDNEKLRTYVIFGNGYSEERNDPENLFKKLPDLIREQPVMLVNRQYRILLHNLNDNYAIVFPDVLINLGTRIESLRFPHMIFPYGNFNIHFEDLINALLEIYYTSNDNKFMELFNKLHHNDDNIICDESNLICNTTTHDIRFVNYMNDIIFGYNVVKHYVNEEDEQNNYTSMIDLVDDIYSELFLDGVSLIVGTNVRESSLIVKLPISKHLNLIDIYTSLNKMGFRRSTTLFVHKNTNIYPYLFQIVYATLMNLDADKVVAFSQYSTADYRVSTSSFDEYFALFNYLWMYSTPDDNKVVGIVNIVDKSEVSVPITEDIEININKLPFRYKMHFDKQSFKMKEFITEILPMLISR